MTERLGKNRNDASPPSITKVSEGNRGPMFPGSKNSILRAALVAMGLVGPGTSVPADAQHIGNKNPQLNLQQQSTTRVKGIVPVSDTVVLGQEIERLQNKIWARSVINDKNDFVPADLQRFENLVHTDAIDLDLQIRFLEKALFRTRSYGRELYSDTITLVRLNEILGVVNTVVTRMNALSPAERKSPNMHDYFNIDHVKTANRHFHIEFTGPQVPGKEPRKKFCNGFLVQDAGDVYFITAKHCIEDSVIEKEFTASTTKDQAVRYISPDEYQNPKWCITDPGALPTMEKILTPNVLSGAVVATYSWGPKKGSTQLFEKIHYSFALKMSQHAAGLVITNPPHEGALAFITNPDATKITQRDVAPDGKVRVVSVGASGSSGSAISVSQADKGHIITADFEAVRPDYMKDAAPYPIGFFGNPVTLRDLIAQERRERYSSTYSHLLKNK